MADVGLHVVEQVLLGLVLRQAGDLLQHFQLAALDLGDLFLLGSDLLHPLGQLVLFLFVGVQLFVQGLLLLLKAALLALEVGAAVLDLPFVFCARFMDFFLGFQQHFALFGFAALDRVVQDAGRFCFCAADFPFGVALAVCDTE